MNAVTASLEWTDVKGLPVSYAIGDDILNLRPAPRPGHVIYCTHQPLRDRVLKDTGLKLEDAWECDLTWNTHDGPRPWSELGRVTDMGHAEFLADGSDRRDPAACPFKTVVEARAFDAVSEYGLPDVDALAVFYSGVYRDARCAYPNQVVTGGYYKTLISGAIEIFGWDMLLQLAADQDVFERVLDTIFAVTQRHCEAWSRTEIDVFLLHDDMVWSRGPFMDPLFYRRVVFPSYARVVRMMHEAGKKVLFCSDGNWTVFIDDVAGTGADGFIFESVVPLQAMADRFGRTHVLVGSAVDCRTLTFGGPDAIRAEIDATLEVAAGCPGLFIAVGNHIPGNVPVDNALFYFDYLRRHWLRAGR